jgi:two-component system sensor histidine kinase UhpB
LAVHRSTVVPDRYGSGARVPITVIVVKRPSLLAQVLAVNALLITATVLTATVAVHLDPDTVADHRRLGLLVAAVLATVLANGVLLRRRFAPLEQLIAAMETVDFAARRSAVSAPRTEVEEVARLRQAYDRMLARLQAERARTASAVLQAQESERARVARDLHDEANQALTGVLLRLQASAEHAPPDLRAELRETQAVATQAMEELLRLARELRPAALDDHGLAAALRTLVTDFGRRAGLDARFTVEPGVLETLDDDGQLVAYRVVQEGLSNIARHAGARRVTVSAAREDDDVVVRIDDDGVGFDLDTTPRGLGLRGMRERAVLAGGRMCMLSVPGEGTLVEARLRPAAGTRVAAAA